MQYGVIMAGGSGTRLWPLSRGNKPKQLLPVIKGKSLLQLSWDRLCAILPPERIFVCTGAAYADQVLANLPDMPVENLLGEPVGRDTANAVGFAAAVLHKMDQDAVFAIVTADHVIEPIEQFTTALQTAFRVVAENPWVLVTFGIVPTFGHTGLGYIHRGEELKLQSGDGGAYRVQAFKEKPDKATADRYVESDRYYWNSGMFVWRAETVLGEIKSHLPASFEGLSRIADAWGTDQQESILKEVYSKLPKISIDYAVMEPAAQGKDKASVAVVEMPVNWLDVGSWTALAETMPVDEHNNAYAADKFVYLDSDDNIIFCTDPNHVVSLIGISDMIVVHTPDATMICPKNESQRVKDLVGKVKDKFGERYS